MSDTLTLRVLRFLPRNLLSRATGWLAERRRPQWLVRRILVRFARRYRINLGEAERPLADYASVLELFTRRLRPGARPIAPDPEVLVSPVDGRVGSLGRIADGTLVQAKGMEYGLAALLGSEAAAKPFVGGAYITIYLAPTDYHRIHAPIEGNVTRSLHEPGTLWPVNPPSVATVPALFATNERITAVMDSAAGAVAVTMVGATNVGRIRLAYEPYTTNRRGRHRRVLEHQPVHVERGQELAVFELGSTVIVLVAGDRVAWTVETGQWIPMGSVIGRL